VKDPLETADVRIARPWAWVLLAAVLLVLYVQLFPEAFAVAAVLLSLPMMIFLHELAHFVTAKRAGMKVTEFFVGFGPRVWSFRRGETEYGLKAVPLGGYCKIIGMTNLEEVAATDEPRAYRQKGFVAKVVVAGAGSAMHFALATFLIFTVLWIGGDYRDVEATTTIDDVEEGLPAAAAGIRPGDRVVAVDDVAVDEWRTLIDHLAEREAGDTVRFTLERDGRTRAVDVTLRNDTIDGVTRPVAGVRPAVHVPQLSFADAAVEAPRQIGDLAWRSLQALGDMFSPSGIANYFDVLAGDDEAEEDQRFVSPVGFGRLASQAVQSGWVDAFGLLIAINVFVGLFNLVPLLPFDGGHIAIATYERLASWVRRRPVRVDAAKLLPITAVVMSVLAFIFLSSLFLDVSNPIENPY
jgi:membrane-associated protease RseP (regulator of RpoE activity)